MSIMPCFCAEQKQLCTVVDDSQKPRKSGTRSSGPRNNRFLMTRSGQMASGNSALWSSSVPAASYQHFRAVTAATAVTDRPLYRVEWSVHRHDKDTALSRWACGRARARSLATLKFSDRLKMCSFWEPGMSDVLWTPDANAYRSYSRAYCSLPYTVIHCYVHAISLVTSK